MQGVFEELFPAADRGIIRTSLRLVTSFRLERLPPRVDLARSPGRPELSAICVRREKAALSSGCKSHPANAPAGSNRSSHGGDEMAEAFGVAGHV